MYLITVEPPRLIATYEYDEWGKVKTVRDATGAILTSPAHLANRNPFRYRGYHYDIETGFYYLQSRYYDPAISRFINADEYASTGQDFLGCNMFTYCGNNPVVRKDESGELWQNILIGAAIGFVAAVVTEVATTIISGEKLTVANVVSAGVGGAVSGGLLGAGFSSDVANTAGTAAKTVAKGVFNGDSVGKIVGDTLVESTKTYVGGKITSGVKNYLRKGVSGKYQKLNKFDKWKKKILWEPKYLNSSAPKTILANKLQSSVRAIGKAAFSRAVKTLTA